MARHPWLDPSPFQLPNGPTGVLLIHGFTGAPTEMRPLGEFLAGHGYGIACPLLPGHGTEPADLNQVTWQDWARAVDTGFQQLLRRSHQVFVAGFSMGGLLALHLAAHQPRVKGLLLLAPGYRVSDWRLPLSIVAKHAISLLPRNGTASSDLTDPEAHKRLWTYESYPVAGAEQLWRLQRVVRRELNRVTQPMILLQGRLDRSIRPDSAQAIMDGISSTDRRLVWLEDSGHALLVDAQQQLVFDICLDWIQRHDSPSPTSHPKSKVTLPS